MKLFIRQRHTKQLYAGTGGWVADAQLALAFPSVDAALAEFPEPNPSLELMVCSEITLSKILIPLGAIRRALPAQLPEARM